MRYDLDWRNGGQTECYVSEVWDSVVHFSGVVKQIRIHSTIERQHGIKGPVAKEQLRRQR